MRISSSTFRRYISLRVLIGIMVCLLSRPMLARAGGIDSISPAAARVGETVTIKGHGFGAINVKVTVGAVSAQVLAANGNQVTFRVPGGVAPGLTEVVATNPGFHSGSIDFLMLEGILLSGDPTASVKDAIFDLPPVAVDDDVVQDGLILTRLDVHLSPSATVAQLNAALDAVDGGVVSMLHGLLTVTIAIPQPSDATAMNQIASSLETMPGITLVTLGRVPGIKQLPPSPAGDSTNWNELIHLFPARFPAAWNASALAINGVNDQSPCSSRKVNMLVADEFGDPTLLTAATSQIAAQVHGLTIFGATPANGDSHGYSVSATAAGNFDGTEPTGADPFPDCLNVEGVELSNLTFSQTIVRIKNSFPSSLFLMNYSNGYTDTLPCIKATGGCTAQDVLNEVDTSLARAYDAADWKAATFDRWNDFLIGVAGGNEKDESGTAIYPGLGVAVTDSFMSMATLSDAFFAATVQNANLWDPQLLFNGVQLPSLRPPDAGSFEAFQQYASGEGADSLGPEPNVLMVGATTAGFTVGDVAQETYSDSNPDVFAVGDVTLVSAQSAPIKGTSFAAPQVTGLASYLWLLSGAAKANNPAFNDLRSLPASITRRAILDNAQTGLGVNLIDAYASALSVDDVLQLPTPRTAPVRMALLDLNNDGKFDEGDLAAFFGIYFDSQGNPREPAHPDFSRFDLNGDGFTGGSRTTRFDLDRVGSTQYGAANYGTVTQQIEGKTVSFDETRMTDMQILCYYAYSSLYTGDTNTRKQLIGGTCALTITPQTATLAPGQTQLFTASAPATFTVSGGGTITKMSATTALFTAGQTAGPFTVTATSVSGQTAQAGVAVTAPSGGSVRFIGRNSGVNASAFLSCTTNTGFGQKSFSNLGIFGDSVDAGLACTDSNGITQIISNTASQNVDVEITSHGGLLLSGTGNSFLSYTVDCPIGLPPGTCPTGILSAGNGSSLSLDFEVVGSPQSYSVVEQLSGRAQFLILNHTLNTFTFFPTSQSGTLDPGKYTFEGGVGAGGQSGVDAGTPSVGSFSVTFKVGSQ